MSGELATFLIAMTPVGELRAAIPLALGFYKMSVFSAFFWSVSGNIAAVIIILILIKPVSGFLISHFPFFNRFLKYLFARTRKNFSASQIKWGELALIIFVAIPFPATGGWSGALVAYLFGIPFKRALFLISAGVVIAGVLVMAVSLGILKAFF